VLRACGPPLVGPLGVSYTCGMSGASPPVIKRPEKLSAGPAAWQRWLYEVIFEHRTRGGRAFDVLLLVVILVSILAVMLESVGAYRARWGSTFFIAECVITGLFSIEFLLRLACVNNPWRYVFSFFGLVDILAILPSFLMPLFSGAQSLATIRTLRLLRVFRILKLARHVQEAQGLLWALRRTWPKITVFISVIVCAIIILGTVMYLVEQNAGSGFDNIPVSVYWAIVTMTTVGYGDIAPVTPLGKTIASLIMLLGYAIIIVPTGLFSAEVITKGVQRSRRRCPGCGHSEHGVDAEFCNRCGAALVERSNPPTAAGEHRGRE
jgi:voltage-gated potassium channel